MSIQSLCNGKANVERPTYSQDAYGAVTETYTVVLADVPCRLQGKRSRETVYGDRKTLMSDYVLYCSPRYAIYEKDRIIHNNATYQVVGVDADHDNLGVLQVLDLLKIT